MPSDAAEFTIVLSSFVIILHSSKEVGCCVVKNRNLRTQQFYFFVSLRRPDGCVRLCVILLDEPFPWSDRIQIIAKCLTEYLLLQCEQHESLIFKTVQILHPRLYEFQL